MDYKNISSVKSLRKEFKLTQGDFSYLLGMSVRNYREKECGKTGFNQCEIMKIIHLFGLSSEDVFRIFYQKSHDSIFWKNTSKEFEKIETTENNLRIFKR